jgi:hypothetical protein
MKYFLFLFLASTCGAATLPPALCLVVHNWQGNSSLGDYIQSPCGPLKKPSIDFRDYAAALNPKVAVIWGSNQTIADMNYAAIMDFNKLTTMASEWRGE